MNNTQLPPRWPCTVLQCGRRFPTFTALQVHQHIVHQQQPTGDPGGFIACYVAAQREVLNLNCGSCGHAAVAVRDGLCPACWKRLEPRSCGAEPRREE